MKLFALANGTGREDASPTKFIPPGRGRVLAARMVTHTDATDADCRVDKE